MESEIKDINKLVTYIKEAWVNNPFPDIIFGCIGKGILDFALEHIKNINDLVDTEESSEIKAGIKHVADIKLNELIDKSRLIQVVADVKHQINSLLENNIRIVAGTLRMVMVMTECNRAACTLIWLETNK